MSDEKQRPYIYGSTLRAARAPMRKLSAKKQRERYGADASEKVAYGPYHRYVKAQYDCALAGHPLHVCAGPIDGHHVQLVSQGGVDEANVLPLCRRAHEQMHALGSHELFDAGWNIDSADLARIAWEKYRQSGGVA